ncbi:MAG: sortase [Candidatus Pacebacteria bacterium]|nr:sortase [Candidatus Paceibacterota bacterium]
MALYCYLKSPSSPPRRINSDLKRGWGRPGIDSAKKGRFFSGFLIGLGVIILLVVLGSFGFYQVQSSRNFAKKDYFLSPLPKASVLGESQKALPAGYQQPAYWFSSPPPLPFKNSKITHYNLSIPVLGINRAVVEIGGEDLGKSMVHYPGTAFPGEKGNAVVFCHSVLPQFFNPKNYKTICSTLPTMKTGDEILIYFDGIEYAYQVFEMIEVQPTNISVLEPDLSGEYLSMITCVPPGTYLRRLIVKARLI